MKFPFSLSDSHWESVASFLPNGRKRKYSVRLLFTAMVYVCKTGCQWRSLPPLHFPPWQVVYYYFRRWSHMGYLQSAMKILSSEVRLKEGRSPRPSIAIIDAQSIRTAAGVKHRKGWDGAKKLKGRKRHLLTDSLGLPLGIRVGSGGAPDRAGLLHLQQDIEGKGLKAVFADQGYVGIQLLSVPVCVVRQRPKSKQGPARFQVVEKRWVVERSFGWLTHYRRLNRDYEKNTQSAEAMINLAFINMLSARLTAKT